ncbi:hypothetical protein OE88DRAFT_627136 [Heliocybe sulcata]|uniref:Uncharacterized protein n=1 Tax=Heliocybe sulcata TaxID=5364 RepID=A0A5C3NDP9_9AGAM|nr:hypothetical protein OE88DRAFT_627136 [Heliocybe sulcata]
MIQPSALGHDKAQSIIDQITAAYETSGGPPPGGFGFGPPHLGPPAPSLVLPDSMDLLVVSVALLGSVDVRYQPPLFVCLC